MAGVTSIKTASGTHAEVKGKYIKTGASSYAQIKKGYVKAANPAYLGLPTGYTQVEYIESSGTQYIDTGVTPSATDNKIILDFTTGNVEGSLFGAYSSGKDTLTCFWGQFWITGSSPINYTLQSGMDYLLTAHAQNNTITADLNGDTRTGSYSNTMPTGASFALFAQNNGTEIKNYCAMKLRRAKIYVDGDMVRDFVPCKNASNAIGLYDMVDGTFYANAGTGAFTAGNAVKAIDAMLFYESTKSISTATVTLGANLTYNGSQQTKAVTVTMDGVTLTQGTDYTVTGNTATNAGNYTMTITGTGDYEGTVQKAWSIARASGSISVSPTSLSIAGAAGTTKTATISYTGDGSISVSSSNSSVATASRSGNTITVTLKATGSATITISIAETDNCTGASCTLGVTCMVASATLVDNSWETIAAVSAAGAASSVWSVGDTKTETLNGTSYTFRIAGFDHDNLNSADAKYSDSSYNGGKKKAGITFEMAEIFVTPYYMNVSDTNSGGWDSSNMRSTVMQRMKGYMPTALQNVLRTVSKRASAGDESSTIKISADELFLLSEVEVRGTTNYSCAGEGTQYAYYKAGNSTVKGRVNINGWWLRSPHATNKYCFIYIHTGDYIDYISAGSYYGVAFGFCV